MTQKHIIISDPTLRDGNHAARHQLSAEQIRNYCEYTDAAGVPIVEVGHGNGIGASSLLVGKSKETDLLMLKVAREALKKSKLGVHSIPGFATTRNLQEAIDSGVDVFRIASHCSEADITASHLEFLRNKNKTVYGVLMMSHMISAEELAKQAEKMESYGAQAVVIMDSAGAYLPSDVTERIKALTSAVKIAVGFHGHNNLGMAVANSVAAVEAGASILDGTAKGFGAGAGNTQLEVLVAVLHKLGYETGIDFYKLLDASDMAAQKVVNTIPTIDSISIVSGLAGVFSGFKKHVERVSAEYNINPRDLFFALGKRKVVAGQEDIIIEVAAEISKTGITQEK
jgi:4-hydroxy 2-oxovalerate aldolase